MGIHLEKKQKFDLTKKEPSLNNVYVGFGWDFIEGYNEEIDADVSVFMIDSNSKIPEDSYFVFYNNLSSGDGSVFHQGDILTVEGIGDEECVNISLSDVNSSVEQMIFVITIHDSENKGQDIGNLNNSYMRIVKNDTKEEICRFTLDETFGGFDSVQIGRIYRDGNNWKVEAIGEPFRGGLAAQVELYT